MIHVLINVCVCVCVCVHILHMYIYIHTYTYTNACMYKYMLKRTKAIHAPLRRCECAPQGTYHRPQPIS